MYIDLKLVFFFTFVTGVTSVPSLKYDVRLPVDSFRYTRIFDVSIGRCNEECLARPGCKSINYLTRLHLCELNDFDSTERTLSDRPGYVYVDKTPVDQTSIAYQCNPKCSLAQVCQQLEGKATCSVEECPTPTRYGDGPIQGNLRQVGSRIVYQCPYGHASIPDVSKQVVSSTCLQSGTWTPASFTCNKCPAGWIHYDGSCYSIGASPKSFQESREYCASLGSHLIWIETLKENDIVTKTIYESGSYPVCVHIGVTDFAEEGVWVYVETNTTAAYTNWAPEEPDIQTVQNCVGVLDATDYHFWVNYACAKLCQPLCEKEAH